MVSCCSCGYSRTAKTKDSGVSFHRFPVKGAYWRLNAWKKLIDREKWSPTAGSMLCSKHFDESNFIREFGKVTLKPDAVPTIKIERLKYARGKYEVSVPADPLSDGDVDPLSEAELKKSVGTDESISVVYVASPKESKDLLKLRMQNALMTKKIKMLQQSQRRDKKTIATLKEVIHTLRKKPVLSKGRRTIIITNKCSGQVLSGCISVKSSLLKAQN